MLFQNKQSIERKSLRKYERAEYAAPLQYKSFSADPVLKNYSEDFEAEGLSKDISPGGMAFQTKHRPPRISSVLWLGLDQRTVNTVTIGAEPTEKPLMVDRGFLGKVVHVEEDPKQRAYNVGISFITKFGAALP